MNGSSKSTCRNHRVHIVYHSQLQLVKQEACGAQLAGHRKREGEEAEMALSSPRGNVHIHARTSLLSIWQSRSGSILASGAGRPSGGSKPQCRSIAPINLSNRERRQSRRQNVRRPRVEPCAIRAAFSPLRNIISPPPLPLQRTTRHLIREALWVALRQFHMAWLYPSLSLSRPGRLYKPALPMVERRPPTSDEGKYQVKYQGREKAKGFFPPPCNFFSELYSCIV